MVDTDALGSGPFTLHEAGPDDGDAIGRLPGLSGSSVRLLGSDLAADDTCCLVVRGNGEVVGYAAALSQHDEAHITDLAVETTWRRRGIATFLVEELCRRMRERGMGAVTLEVRAGNVGALALYRRLGFAVEGRRARYYQDGEDALILWRRDHRVGVVEEN